MCVTCAWKYRRNFYDKCMHDHTFKGLKQLSVIKISDTDTQILYDISSFLRVFYYTVTAQKFKYTVIFYLNTTLCLPIFIRLISLKDSLFNASKIGVIKYRAVVKDNIKQLLNSVLVGYEESLRQRFVLSAEAEG